MDILIDSLKDDIDSIKQTQDEGGGGGEYGNIVIDNFKVDLDVLQSTFTYQQQQQYTSSSLENAIEKLNHLFSSELNSIKYQVNHYHPNHHHHHHSQSSTHQDSIRSSNDSNTTIHSNSNNANDGGGLNRSSSSSSSSSFNNNNNNNNNNSNSNNTHTHTHTVDNESEWRYLIDAEIADLYELVKELKKSLIRKKVTEREIESPSSPILSGKVNNVELYMHNNTFTNILHLKNDLIQILQALPSTPTIPVKHPHHHNDPQPVVVSPPIIITTPIIDNTDIVVTTTTATTTTTLQQSPFKIPSLLMNGANDDSQSGSNGRKNKGGKSNQQHMEITVSKSAPSSPRSSRSRSTSTSSPSTSGTQQSISASTSRDHSPSPSKSSQSSNNHHHHNASSNIDLTNPLCNITSTSTPSSPLKKSLTIKNQNYQPGSFVIPRSPSKNNVSKDVKDQKDQKDQSSSSTTASSTTYNNGTVSKKHNISSSLLSSRKSLDEQEEEMKNWIQRTLSLELKDTSPHLPNESPLSHHLRSGVVLCQLVNAIHGKPLIKKINNMPSAFFQIENIINFCQACKTLGLQDIPSPMDIHSSVNPKLFLQILYNLARVTNQLDLIHHQSNSTNINNNNISSSSSSSSGNNSNNGSVGGGSSGSITIDL